MSYILRSAVKYSLTSFRVNPFRKNLCVFSDKTFAHLNSYNKNDFHTLGPQFNRIIDKRLTKLDEEVRRIGRVSLREVENIFKEIQTRRSATSTQSLMIIRCCGNLLSEESPEKRTELVQQIWKTFEDLNVGLDITHYNALLKVYLENEHEFVPTEILSELEKKGLEPNRVTYQRFFTRYCQNGDIAGATRILEFMKEKEMPINEAVFNSLVLGHCQANDMESAEGVLNIMKQAGINPSAETYTILICGFAKQGNLKKVDEILQSCETNEISFINKDYLEIAYRLALYDLDVDNIMSKIQKNNKYNQETINYIYKLINAGKVEAAFKLMKSMVRNSRLNGTVMPSGDFFITNLVVKDRPFEEIKNYCDKLIEENLNPYALFTAMGTSLRWKKSDMALKFFRLGKERNIPIRQHYFWPLLAYYGKDLKNKQELLNILATMKTDFDLNHSGDTIQFYVLPYLISNNSDPSSSLLDLKSCGVSYSTATCSIVLYYLIQNNIARAAEIADSYVTYYPFAKIRLPLINSFFQTNDIKSFTTLLKHFAVGIQKRASVLENLGKADEDDTDLPEYRESVGEILLQVFRKLKKNVDGIKMIETILKKLEKKGVGISALAAEKIQNELQDKLTQNISVALEKLISEEYQNIKYSVGQKYSLQNMDEITLERMYETAKQNGDNVKSIQKQLFSIYGRQHNLEKLLKLKEDLDKNNFILTSGMKAYLIESYLEEGKVDEALNAFRSYCEKEPDFTLNSVKLLKLALALVENERYDDATEILSRKGVENDPNHFTMSTEHMKFLVQSFCWRILNYFAEKGDVEKINQFYNLITTNMTEKSNTLFGPLIKVHIINNDISAAVKVFENACLKYRLTPWKNQLSKKLIEIEDVENLQKITDLSTQVHGEMNSLYDLMLSFLECGRVKQAKKIAESPGFGIRNDRVQIACQTYQNSGAMNHLENLLELTKDMNSVNRSNVYYNLLLLCNKSQDYEKGLSLWMQMQEEGIAPSESFLLVLAQLLERNGQTVPFIVPDVSRAERPHSSEAKIPLGNTSQHLRRLLQNKNVDKAFEFMNKSNPEKFNNTDLSLLVESLLKQRRYEDAKKIVLQILSRDALPLNKILKFFIINCEYNGDVEFVELLEPKLSEEIKKYVRFNSRSCQTYVKAGLADKYLAKLEAKLDSVKDEADLDNFVNNFPRGPLLGLLLESPENLPSVQRIADKCLEKSSKCLIGVNLLWLYNIIRNNYEVADDLWKKYIQTSDQPVYFRPLVGRAYRNKDLNLLNKLLTYLTNFSCITPSALGVVYGKMLEILVANDEVEKALNVLNETIEKIPLTEIDTRGLKMLKTACASKSIPFDHDIEKSKKKFDEESDSDSDKEN